MLKKLCLVVLALMLAGMVSVAEAQSGSDEWQFQIAPLYLWAVNIDGTMNIKGLQCFHCRPFLCFATYLLP